MAPEPVIDSCAFHEWASPNTLVPYMSSGWGEVVARPGDITGPMNIRSQLRLDDPRGRKDAAATPANGPAGSDIDLLVEQLLAGGTRDRVVLGYDDGLLATAYPLPYLARQVVHAANDWTVAEWLERDDRLYGQVLVATSLPEDAAAEIRRVGTHERMVAVALGTNGLGRPFGHPVYHGIYAAAAELDLPLVLQAESDAAADLDTPSVTAGLPTTYGEFSVLSAQAMMGHVTSLIIAGVFDLYPNLRVLLVGGGAAWVPSFLWRMDDQFKLARKVEAPWLEGLPSEYFARHFRLTTHTLEKPRQPERLAKVLETLPDAESLFLYASGYPLRGWEEPASVAARLPEAWHDGVFRENALQFFRWPDGARRAADRPVAADVIIDRV